MKYRAVYCGVICKVDVIIGISARYIAVATIDMRRLATSPVFAEPLCCLAANRVVQKGIILAIRVK